MLQVLYNRIKLISELQEDLRYYSLTTLRMTTQILDRSQLGTVANFCGRSQVRSVADGAAFQGYGRILIAAGVLSVLFMIARICINIFVINTRVLADILDVSMLFGPSVFITLLTISKILDIVEKEQYQKRLIAMSAGFPLALLSFLIALHQLISKIAEVVIAYIATVPVTIALIVLSKWGFNSLRASSVVKTAVKYGLIGLIMAQFTGNFIVGNNAACSFTNTQKPCYIIEDAGNLFIPLIVSLHFVQYLLLLGRLMKISKLSARQSVLLLKLCFAGCTGIVLIGFIQAISGLPFFNLTSFMSGYLIVSVICMVYPYIRTIVALRQ
jgi:hypothetical protein